MTTRLSYWWHRNRLVARWHIRWGRGYYLSHGPGGAHYLSRAEAAALGRALRSGDMPRRTVPRRKEETT